MMPPEILRSGSTSRGAVGFRQIFGGMLCGSTKNSNTHRARLCERGTELENLSRKGGTAAAGLGGVGIDEVESLAHEGFLVVEDHASEIDEGLGINEHADIFEVEDAVALARLRVEADVVRKAGAASSLDAETQAAFGGRDPLFGQGDADALDSAVG